MTTNPKPGDSNQRLLYKWCLKLSQSNGGAHAPKPGDTKNELLRKILALYNL